ncbi:MAG: hypothetical protein Q8N56_04345 [bacterium]|nr:hypothetical protein [bacterium]
MNKLSKRILVGLGALESKWKDQLKEIDKLKIHKVSLFLECMELPERKKIYNALLDSKIEYIPLVHIRGDMERTELLFLKRNFESSFFTIHEDEFKFLPKWRDFHKNLFLEMDHDSFISKSVKIERIGGFCVDLSHFKAAEGKWSKEFEYTIKKKKVSRYFACNHLNGYSYELNSDLHTIKSLEDFNYLKTLPNFLFSKVIALEMGNSIAEQLKFKKYLLELLPGKLK